MDSVWWKHSPKASTVDPLFVFTFLQKFADILQDYLGDVSSSTLKDNFDVVYQVSPYKALSIGS